MAKRTREELIDDIDGTEADSTVKFSLDDVSYEIDLTDAHAEELRLALQRYIDHARRTGGRRAAGTGRRSGTARGDSAAVREWARANGYTVSDRGRVSSEVREAFALVHK